jgi:hypothetical protein
MMLAACTSRIVSTPGADKAATEAQRVLALARMPADQRRAAYRPALPAGTKVYAIDTLIFAVPNGQLIVPKSSIITVSGARVTLRNADGSIESVDHAKLIAEERSGEAYVKPGSPVPGFLRGQTPEQVIR